MGVVADAAANESRGFKHMASEPPKPSPGFQLGGDPLPVPPQSRSDPTMLVIEDLRDR